MNQSPVVLLVGASGVGKTTLAKQASAKLGLKIPHSSRTEIYAKHGVTFEQAYANKPLLGVIQREVCLQMLDVINEVQQDESVHGNILDRSLDVLVYTEFFGVEFPHDICDRIVKSIRAMIDDHRALILLVRPLIPILQAARAEEAKKNRRAMFLGDYWVENIDRATRCLLEDCGLPYTSLDTPSPDARLAPIAQFIKKCEATRGIDAHPEW